MKESKYVPSLTLEVDEDYYRINGGPSPSSSSSLCSPVLISTLSSDSFESIPENTLTPPSLINSIPSDDRLPCSPRNNNYYFQQRRTNNKIYDEMDQTVNDISPLVKKNNYEKKVAGCCGAMTILTLLIFLI